MTDERTDSRPPRRLTLDERQRAVWDRLELPAPAAAPPGFAAGVARRAEADESGLWTAAPRWARAAAAAALLVGLACGALVGSRLPAAPVGEPWLTEPSLAEQYLYALEDPAAESAAEGRRP